VESVESCAPIAGKSELIPETSAATVAIFAKMSEIAEVTSANFVRTSARARRRLNYEQIGRSSESIRATSVAIAVISVQTFVIDEATCATSGKIAGRRGTINEHEAEA
jgi:hypothetical protein